MFNCKYILIFCLFSLLSAGHAQAATTSCTSTNCETLGYTMTAAACNGQTLIRCPFDTNKVICRPSLNTPVFNLVKNVLTTHAYVSDLDNIRLETSLDDLCGDDWMGNCSYSFCWDIDGSGPNVDCDETDFELFLTVGDIVTWVENKMMGGSTPTDPCTGYVTVNSDTEVCTSYCSTDSSKCMVKRALTCDEAISNRGGTKLTSGGYSTLANANYYLTKDVSFTNTVSSISSVHFYEAASLPACAKDSSITKRPKLTFKTVNKIAYTTFEVDTDIEYLRVAAADSVTIVLSRNFRAQLNKYTNSSWNQSVTFILYDNADKQSYDVSVGLTCEGNDSGDSYIDQCTTMFDSNVYSSNVNVTWCDIYFGSGRNNVTCTGASSDFCTKSEDDYACTW